MAETKTNAQREAEWWNAWWDADFTWDGLANKQLQGWVVADDCLQVAETGRIYGQPAPSTPTLVIGKPATVQDYWRADPETGRLRAENEMRDELVGGPNQPLFHRIHAPLAFRDGSPTGKADWVDDALDDLIATRLLVANETIWEGEYEDRKICGADGRAQFGGAVLLAGFARVTTSPLSIDACRSAFTRTARFDSATFLGDACFDSATFSADAYFDSATFSGDARFDSATFSADAYFFHATFSGDTGFESATFSGDARFIGATFSGDGTFDSATFSADASFIMATFSEYGRFNSATFSGVVGFNGATFGDGRFDGAIFSGYAHFSEATFSGDADFMMATFSGIANFNSATFSEDALFHRATFSGFAAFVRATFSEDALFNSATFSADAYFDRATFSGDACFSDGRWFGPVSFIAAVFGRAADFQRSVFSELTWFDSAQFCGDIDFTAAVFDKLASFESITWPEAARDWHSAFDQALFRGTLNLYGADFKAFAAFDGATLERGLQFDETDERSAKKVFDAERLGAIAASKVDADRFEAAENEQRAKTAAEAEATATPVTENEKRSKEAIERETRLRELERGLRVLKLAMEQASDKSREQLFYRFELQARRAQKNLPLGEKSFSYLYAATSDYGASIWRPFAALATLIVSFAVLYYSWGFGFDAAALKADGWNGVFQALDLSWSNVFKPLSALSTENDFRDKNELAFRLLYNDAGGVDGQGFAVRAVSTLQSLLALALAFLLALAVRRRFQIS